MPAERAEENTIAMGGRAAAQAFGQDDTGDSSDMSWVLSRINEHAPDCVAIELGWAESEAQRIVAENRDRVDRLATALLQREELADPAEIRAVIEGR